MSRHARNGAEARKGLALPRHHVVERSRMAFPIKSVSETAPGEAADSTISWRSGKAGSQLGHTYHGTGGRSSTRRHQYVRTCPASSYR